MTSQSVEHLEGAKSLVGQSAHSIMHTIIAIIVIVNMLSVIFIIAIVLSLTWMSVGGSVPSMPDAEQPRGCEFDSAKL